MVMLVQKVSGIAVNMIKNMSGKLTVINDIDLESYIKGVVPSEMPASWEFEALKAQAIAAKVLRLQILVNNQEMDMI